MGRVTGVRSPSGEWVNYSYNNLGQLLGVPGYVDQAPEYDAAGLLVALTAANGLTHSWEYDGNGRLVGLSYENQTEMLKGYTLTYDAANNIVQRNQDIYRYDALNQLVFANLQGKFEIDPDEEEQRIGRTLSDYQGAKPLEWEADSLEVIELDYAAGSIGVDLEAPVMVSRIELTPASPVHRVDATDLAVFYSLDNISYTEAKGWQLKEGMQGELMLTLQTPVQAQYVKVKSYFDERDAVFAPVNAAEFVNDPSELIKVYYYTTSRAEQYVYDNMGNRLMETITQRYSVSRQYSYYPNSNQMKTNGKYGFAYDANGNLIKKGRSYTSNETSVTFAPEQGEYWEYAYDLLNRLTKVSRDGAVVAEYTYDENGLRLKKASADKTTYYIFDLGGEVLYEQEEQEYLEYVYILGRHFARVDGNLTDDRRTTYFYHTDHLGSAVLVTDVAGEVVWSSEYTPFGKVALEEGVLDKAARFTGKELDAETGLYYFNARWYDAEIGRFVSVDPVRDGLNWYAYALNCPLKYIDPTGYANEVGIGGGAGDDKWFKQLKDSYANGHLASDQSKKIERLYGSEFLADVLKAESEYEGFSFDVNSHIIDGLRLENQIQMFFLMRAVVEEMGKDGVISISEQKQLFGTRMIVRNSFQYLNLVEDAKSIFTGEPDYYYSSEEIKDAIFEMECWYMFAAMAGFELAMMPVTSNNAQVTENTVKGAIGKANIASNYNKKISTTTSGKPLYRVMSQGELNAVKTTKMLRGGREGTTYFTDSYFKNANVAKSRLALPQKPQYIVEFEITNKPIIKGGFRVTPNYGELGGGREYFTDDLVQVIIINYQKMVP